MLQTQGYAVGLYTSPHLRVFNERIQISGVQISDVELSVLVKEIRELCEELGISPTFFEFTTALAFLYFSRQGAEIAVIEVGMGGLLDATNVVTPLVSVITMIGHDHMHILGTTLLEIASNKAGIIKEGVPVVLANQPLELLDYFESVSNAHHSSLYVVGRDILLRGITSDLSGQTFMVSGLVEGEYEIAMLGDYQIENAGLALLALHVLAEQGVEISDESLRLGMKASFWRGRLEVVSLDPLVIVDGAHNPEGVVSLARFLDNRDIVHGDVLVLALKQGKHYQEMLDMIVPRFSKVIVTEGTYQPMPMEELGALVGQVCDDVELIRDPRQASARGRALLPAHGCMLVTGSLYMIGSALEGV